MAKADTKIRILQDTVCGGERVRKGRTINATDSEARLLIAYGKAERVDEKGKAAADPPPAGPLGVGSLDAPVAGKNPAAGDA